MSTQRIPVCRKCGSLEVVEERCAIETPPHSYDGGDPVEPPAPYVIYNCTSCGERFVGAAVRSEA